MLQSAAKQPKTYVDNNTHHDEKTKRNDKTTIQPNGWLKQAWVPINLHTHDRQHLSGTCN